MTGSVSHVCRSTVVDLGGGLACCVYILDNNGSNEFSPDARNEAIAGLFASHIAEADREADVQAFAELAVSALGSRGQAGFSPGGGPSLRSGEFFLASHYWGFARLIPAKSALVILLCRPSDNSSLGWAAINSAATRLESLLLRRSV